MQVKYPTKIGDRLYTNRQTGTAYTLSPNDNGNRVTLNNSSAVTLTVPAGLGDGFNCLLQAIGAGTVTVTGATGVTLVNVDSLFAISGQYGIATILVDLGDVVTVSGNLA